MGNETSSEQVNVLLKPEIAQLLRALQLATSMEQGRRCSLGDVLEPLIVREAKRLKVTPAHAQKRARAKGD